MAEGTTEEPVVEEVDYQKYFNAPYNIKEDSREHITPNNGNLEYENNILSLPGRNGLNLNIIIRYKAQDGELYEPDYDIDVDYDYKVKKYETQYWSNWIGTEIYKPKKLISSQNCETYTRAKNSAKAWANSSYIEQDHWEDGTDLIVVREAEIIKYLDYRRETNIINKNTYTELRNNLGLGWSLGFSSIKIDGSNKYLHLGNGQVYKIKITPTIGDSNLDKYTLKDMRIENIIGNYTNGQETSYYELIYKNGTKEYFAKDGRLLGIKDRYGNEIKFNHIIINGHPVINKITDTLGRITTITYNNTATGKEVIITAPNKTKTILALKPTSVDSSKYVLTKIIDPKNRQTQFSYKYQNGRFTFFDKNFTSSPTAKTNIFATLETIIYPTGAKTKYTYEKAIANLGSRGIKEYYRIKTREDIEDGVSYNKETYSYSSNDYSGYPQYKDPSSLPSTFTYTTTITDTNNTKTIYTFNNKNLNTKIQIKQNGTTLLRQITKEYDKNKLPIRKITIAYTPSTGASASKAVTYKYNDYKDLLEYTDELGHKTTYTYDSKYHILTSESKYMNASTIQKTEYGVNQTTGNIDWKKQRHIVNGTDKSIITYYTYDTYGNIKTKKLKKQDGTYIQENYEYSTTYKNAYLTRKYITVKNYNGESEIIEEKYTYDFNTGKIKTYTDGNGNTTTYTYDSLKRLTKITNPDRTYKTLEYDDTNNIVTLTDEKGHKKRKIYDRLGRLKKEQEIKNGAWITLKENHYNALSQIDWIKDAKGNITRYEYDALGRNIKIVNPDNTYKKTEYYDAWTYSSETNCIKEIDEEGNSIYYYYDKAGNLRIKNNGKYSYNYYDYVGNLIKTKDENGNSTYYYYDDLNRLIEVKNALGESTKYQYDNQGNLTKQTTPKGNTTERYYDELGRLIKETDPLGKSIYIKYDKVGNIKEKIDKKGQVEILTYDKRNRLIKRQKGTISISYTYDNVGRVLTMTDQTGKTQYQYYENGLLKKEIKPDGRYIYYEYDNNGNRTKMIDYFGKYTYYTYDSLNRLKTVTVDGQTTTYDYYPDSSIKSIIYPGRSKQEYYYDSRNNLTKLISRKPGGKIINQYSYTYDAVGNQLTKTENNKTTYYTYDKLDRIKTVKEPDRTTITYSYDKDGNISKKNIHGL
ncbi:hypothetical protein [Caloranaerobacter sp. DY30410]|uniref:RHS repeat domain-containing protein n=1 Tax=Caloranaerobacter sp. DY30410 TaxID=3238305 RepID=UPI003CFF0BB4